MTLRRADACVDCGTALPAGTQAQWDPDARTVHCADCAAPDLDLLPDVIVLHDRCLLGPNGKPTRANIDHLVVAGDGVWVIDAKTHYGPLEVRRSGGILSPRVERLFINNRDRTGLIEGLQRQVTSVEEVLATAGHDVPVHGALCFVGTTLPWVKEEIEGIPLVGRRGLRALVSGEGELDAGGRAAVAADLKARFVRSS